MIMYICITQTFNFRFCLKKTTLDHIDSFFSSPAQHHVSLLTHLPFIQHVASHLGVFEYWTCKYFKYLNCGCGQFDRLELWNEPEQCEM